MNRIPVSVTELMPIVKERLAAGGEAVITVKGTSMSPFFVDGKTAVTLQKPKAPLRKLDVVLYESNGGYILHRIVGIKDDQLDIEGDALKKIETIPTSAVIAVVKSHRIGEKIIFHDDRKYLSNVRSWRFLRPLRRYLLWQWFRWKGRGSQ